MRHFDPAEPFAVFLRKRRGRSVSPDARHFDNINVEAGSTVDGIAAQAANEVARHATENFRVAGDIFTETAVFDLQQALGSVLHLATPRHGYQPDTKPTHRLLSAAYEALGRIIVTMSDELSIEDMISGMLAAARIIWDVDKGELESDRHQDDLTKVKILIHRLRIIEHQQDIEARRRKREREAVNQVIGKAAENAEIFG